MILLADWQPSPQQHVRRSSIPGVSLQVRWLPSTPVRAARLQQDRSALAVPEGESNLVHRALTRFVDEFGIPHGFECALHKSIPAGAGMGGASSDAAAALRAASIVCGIDPRAGVLETLAAELGSDVPFFLGDRGRPMAAARAQGRGEILTPVTLGLRLDLVVVFPRESLSTATVYAASRVPAAPRSADSLIAGLKSGNRHQIASELMNRLSEPAREIAPRIDEILKSMWRAGLRTCQLTGSGSACFAIAGTARRANIAAARLRAMLQPGAIVMATHTIGVPPAITAR